MKEVLIQYNTSHHSGIFGFLQLSLGTSKLKKSGIFGVRKTSKAKYLLQRAIHLIALRNEISCIYVYIF